MAIVGSCQNDRFQHLRHSQASPVRAPLSNGTAISSDSRFTPLAPLYNLDPLPDQLALSHRYRIVCPMCKATFRSLGRRVGENSPVRIGTVITYIRRCRIGYLSAVVSPTICVCSRSVLSTRMQLVVAEDTLNFPRNFARLLQSSGPPFELSDFFCREQK